MPNRIQRLKECAKPDRPQNWQGCSREESYIQRWSDRATENSDGHKHRAKDGPIELPSTAVKTRDTAMKRKVMRNAERAIRAAREDVDHVGSDFMPNVRRNTE